MTHLLDTSALLAHAFRENGWKEVQSLLDSDEGAVWISALSLYETDRRLAEIGANAADRRAFAQQYTALLDFVAPADETIAAAACALRDVATTRIATLDILIAATAKAHDAILVHRDAHFSAIPAEHLRQLTLPEK